VSFRNDAPRHKQLRDWVADRLRSDILEGRLQAGEWLRQERLAQQLGVSQMPVRDALKQLAAEGLVEHEPYRGVRVVVFAPTDIEDLYTCRAFIEGMAARAAATRISDEEIAELDRLRVAMDRCKMPDELREYRELNRRFHGLVIDISGRSYLVRTLSHMWSAFPTMLWGNFPGVAATSAPDRDEPDAIEHAEIVAAFAARDPERAERAVRNHIEEAGKALLAAVRSNE
jgi:DNA-binding GntR family transcriptional regulator